MSENNTPSSELLSFGRAINYLRQKYAISGQQLAVRAGVTIRTIMLIERSDRRLSSETAEKLIQVFSLPSQAVDLLRQAATGQHISRSALQSAMNQEKQEKTETQRVIDEIIQLAALQAQISDAQLTATRIEARVSSVDQNQIQSSTGDQEPTISEELQFLKQTILNMQATAQELTAPVHIPSRESMGVQLIPSDVVYRLEEYRSDETKWFSWFGVCIGSIIGVFVNVATGGEMKTDAWIILAVFAVAAILTGLSGWQAGQRGKALRQKYLALPSKD